MIIVKCPRCKKDNSGGDIDIAVSNADNYGTDHYVVKCRHCKKNIKILLTRVIKLVSIHKTDEECSFGG